MNSTETEPSTSEPIIVDPSVNSLKRQTQPKSTWTSGIMFNVVVPLILLGIAGVIVMLLGSVQPATRPPLDTTRVGRLRALPPVRVELLQSLEQTGAPLRLQVDGTVVPFREANVAAEVAGKVVFKADECEAGSYVQKDQLLMKIDATDYELEVDRLTRMKEQDYQAIREVDQEMENTKRSIEVAKKDVALQQKEVDRQNAMPKGYSSRAEVDQANRALLAARQQLVGYENQFDLLTQRRIRLETSERLAQTQLRAAEINLQRTEIRAPIEGVIVSEEADLNTFVQRGQTLVVIDDTSKVDVASSLRMDQLYWVLNQRDASVDTGSRNYDLPETPAIIEYVMSGRDNVVYRWAGKLLSYNGIGLDPETRTVPVRVVVDDPNQMVDQNGQPVLDSDGNVRRSNAPALVRGMYVRVKLMIEPKSTLVVIPARALQPGNRVFQFLPDDSVLENKSDANAASPAIAPESVVVDDGFDPDDWMAGNVVLRKNIVPVDSLMLEGLAGTVVDKQAAGQSQFDGVGRMWVCEVQEDNLIGGSMVVVSPLGGVEDEPVPVRADRSGMEESTSNDGALASPQKNNDAKRGA